MTRTVISGVSHLWVMCGKPWFISTDGFILTLSLNRNGVGVPPIMCLIDMGIARNKKDGTLRLFKTKPIRIDEEGCWVKDGYYGCWIDRTYSMMSILIKLPYVLLIFLWCVFNAFLELFEKIVPYLTILYGLCLITLVVLLVMVAV